VTWSRLGEFHCSAFGLRFEKPSGFSILILGM
jgi:hypothetical protein